ncbi:hypothetical protein N7456_011255 [Penicillium angulare]|uniref:Zn(2)-C6 fungal-type domain-containing protein n=1 Tax=Penicillium angulare TaxID=116970 RepID=A0A9W9ETJ7_9EURO|nr:hypothetical protein N7456_011255 [Penicillium angulare]
MPKISNSSPRHRARTVCIRCHSCKVRCDLDSHQRGVCSRCERQGYECQPHIGPRKQRKALRTSLATPHSEAPPLESPVSTTTQQVTPWPDVERSRTINCSATNNAFYADVPNFITGGDFVLEVSHATRLPPPMITQALSDFYFKELFPLVPVLDHEQSGLQDSILLQQSLCFAGSIMRQSTEPAEWSPSMIYGRVKMLLFLRHDPAPFHMLTSLCILGTWLPYEPEAIVLDNPWQWTGMAIRLALQLRLHEEETYTSLQHPGRVRRIWWYLFNNDTMQMACSGRPGMFPLKETRTRLPVASDFDNQDTGAWVFCHLTSLCKLLRKVLEDGQADKSSPEEVYQTLDELSLWRQNLPSNLQLFDRSGETRKTYNRLVVELHIFYLVTTILTSFLGRRDNPSLLKYASMAASSCISRLYEEILLHEEATYLLPIHSWAHLVAATPRAFSDSDTLNEERAHELEVSHQVLDKLSEKHTSAVMIKGRIDMLNSSGLGAFPPQADAMWDSLPAPILDDKKRRVLSLFHFPDNYCPTLDLLSSTGSIGGNQQLDSTFMDNNAVDWSVDWSSFLFDGAMSF